MPASPARMTDLEGLGQLMLVTRIIVDIIEFVGAGAYHGIPMSWKDMALGFEAPSLPKNEIKGRLSQNSLRTLFTRKPAGRITPAVRWATFADLVTASSVKAHHYSSGVYGPTCKALFAANSPYRSKKDTINIFEVRADPAPAPLCSSGDGRQIDPGLVHTFLNRMVACTRHRAVARTSSGALALVDAAIPRVEEGDVVCELIGYDVPVIMRPQNTLDFKTTMTHGIFEFIGEAYVQGMMHGEALALAEELVKAKDQRTGGFLLV